MEYQVMAFFAFILGSMIGSFLNVLIYRLPRGGDIVFARSACPHCGVKIPAYLNIPLLGFAYLRGRCRSCLQRIHWRYPVVEILTASVFVLALPESVNPSAWYGYALTCAMSCALIVHLFIDLEHRLLLDKINLYLLLLVLPYGVIFHSPTFWLGGALLGFGGPFLVSWAFYKIKGKIGLGGGDIKLWGVLGIFLGPGGVMENIFLSCLLGSVVGVLLIWRKQYDSENGIPFGPFIIVVTFIQILFPQFAQMVSLFP